MTARKQRIELRRRLGELLEEAERSGAAEIMLELDDLKELLKAAGIRTTSTISHRPRASRSP
jgi:hypothetical protein